MSDPARVPSTERLLELVDAMAGRPVLMLVDLVADRFVFGAPKRISREAPVLILRHTGERFTPGGGANALANVAALGGRPLPLGVVGADENGGLLVEALAAMGIRTDGIVQRRGYSTPTKVRILGGGEHSARQQIVRYDIEDQVELDGAIRSAFEERLSEWSAVASVAVLSDYGYGAVTPDMTGSVRQALGVNGVVLCDSRYRLHDFEGLDGATPNEEEALALLHRQSPGSADLDGGGERLRRSLGARFLLITRGSHGMSLSTDGGTVHISVHGAEQVADVTGAGDTVIGTFALATAAGASPLEAALLANYAAGVVVMKLGTATLSAAELAAAARSDTRPLEELVWAGS
jgi:rfaE bifunctional protein kinase chain/domain